MDNKPKNKAGKGYSATAESSAAETDSFKRASDLLKKHTEKFGRHMEELFCQEPDSNTVHSFRSVPTVHNFGDMEALSSAPDSDTGTDNTIWRNFADLDNLKSTSDCNEHAEKSSDVNNLSWEVTSLIGDKKVKEPMPLTAVGIKESLLSLSGTPTSATRTGLFFKDKLELPSDLYTVNTFSDNLSYGSARTQELAEDLSISTQSTSPGTLPISVNNPQFLVDSNLDIVLSQIPHMKAEPGCLPSLADESTGNMGYVQQPSKNISTFMSDPIELSIPATSSNSQFWCQSNLREYTHLRTGYRTPGAIQNTCMANAPHKAYSAYLGALPQRVCIICGDEASGCHYGVLTCGSCKVFFKRAVEGHHNYLCAGRNDCIVDKIRRKNCPACRLRKCYQAGMMLGGRKLKKFGAQNTMGVTKPPLVGSLQCLPWASQALVPLPCMPGIQELQFSPQIISVLENIEPDVVYSGYDNSQPDMPNLLLNSLNRLCERQLVWIVKWSKSLPGFRSLHINDQMTLIQYSWMNLMVFSLGWRSFQNVTSEYLYFAPDLILNEEGMKKSPIYDLCLSMQFIPQAFSKLQVTKEEFLCMKALLLLNTVPLEGLQSQAQFEEMRQSYIGELTKAIHLKEKGVVARSQRFYHLTKLMDHMHDIVKKLNLYCLSTFIQAESMRVEFPEMMTEVIASQLPKVLAGMVKPLLFHNK